MDPALKKKVQKQVARVVPGRPAPWFLAGVSEDQVILVTSPRKVDAANFATLAKTEYVDTPPTPSAIAIGVVRLRAGKLVFLVSEGGRGAVQNLTLQGALRGLGVEAGIATLRTCEVVARPKDAPDDEPDRLEAIRVALCGGDGAALAAMCKDFGDGEALADAVDAVGGTAGIALLHRDLFHGDNKRLRTFLLAMAPTPLADIATGWQREIA